jgi:hypothetical protein
MSDQNVPQLPKLGDIFFAVCTTAIRNTSWKYADFEKIKFVEGQLALLAKFVLYQQQQLAIKPATEPQDANVGVEIEPAPEVKTLEEAVNEPAPTTPSPDPKLMAETAPAEVNAFAEPAPAEEGQKKNS